MNSNTTISFLPKLLLTLAILVGVSTSFRINTEKRHYPDINRVYVHCGNEVNGKFEDLTTPVLFYRSTVDEENGQIMTELINGSGIAVIIFDVNSFNEGVFTCVDNITNEISTNNISLVAFPYINSSIFTFPRNIVIPLGHTSPPINCGFNLGILTHYYEIEWWRGTTLLDTTSTNSKYKLLDNLTLIIEDTTINDASDGYYCILSVINSFEGVVYNNTSPDISVQVYNPLSLTSTLTDTGILIEQSTSFTCTAQGVPQPNIRWKINNHVTNPRYNIQEEVSSTSLLYSVTSTLTLSNAALTDTGLVECIAYNNNQEGLVIETNTATLVVFDTPSAPVVVPAQNGEAFLSFTLPSLIPVFFLIHIRYISTADSGNNYETILSSPLFTNTSMITNYVIPIHSLPNNFKSFRTQIAIEIYGTKGQYSTQSSIIVLLEPETTPTITPSPTTGFTCTDTCNDNSGLIVIIVLLTCALIVMLLGTSMIALYFCYCKRKFKETPRSVLPGNDPNGIHDNDEFKMSPLDSVRDCQLPYDADNIRSTELHSSTGEITGDITSDRDTSKCTSSQESGIDEERKSVSSSPPIKHKVKTNDNSPIHRSNHYTLEPANIEALAYEPQAIKPQLTVLPVLIEDNTTPREQREQRKEEENKSKDGQLKLPLYNESMSSAQGNITFPSPPPPPPSSIEASTSHDQRSQSTSISVQTSLLPSSVAVPSFSQITNPSPQREPSIPQPTTTTSLVEGSVTKSLTKILRGYEIV